MVRHSRINRPLQWGIIAPPFSDVLFACDFAFPPGPTMRLNPFGPKSATREGAKRLYQIVRGRTLATVCGYNYVAPFEAWTQDFARAIAAA